MVEQDLFGERGEELFEDTEDEDQEEDEEEETGDSIYDTEE